MHTYLRTSDGKKYMVGQWLPNRQGYVQFTELFSVPKQSDAIRAVNTLNGGHVSLFEIQQTVARCQESNDYGD